jgi:hypothetical protein
MWPKLFEMPITSMIGRGPDAVSGDADASEAVRSAGSVTVPWPISGVVHRRRPAAAGGNGALALGPWLTLRHAPALGKHAAPYSLHFPRSTSLQRRA